MAGRVPDQPPEGQGGEQPTRAGQPAHPERRSDADAAAEREKAETEIAAGDVADDLADFA